MFYLSFSELHVHHSLKDDCHFFKTFLQHTSYDILQNFNHNNQWFYMTFDLIQLKRNDHLGHALIWICEVFSKLGEESQVNKQTNTFWGHLKMLWPWLFASYIQSIMVPGHPPITELMKVFGIVGSQAADKCFFRSFEFAVTLIFDLIPSTCYGYNGPSLRGICEDLTSFG